MSDKDTKDESECMGSDHSATVFLFNFPYLHICSRLHLWIIVVLPHAPSPLPRYYRDWCPHLRNYRGVRHNVKPH